MANFPSHFKACVRMMFAGMLKYMTVGCEVVITKTYCSRLMFLKFIHSLIGVGDVRFHLCSTYITIQASC